MNTTAEPQYLMFQIFTVGPGFTSEGTNAGIEAGPPRIPDEGMQDYLAGMFNHGAAMTNVFGWDVGDDARPQPAGISSAAPALTRSR